jgi:hypothetical protein
MVKVDAFTKRQDEMNVTMIAQYTTLLEELATIKEKMANMDKKKPTARSGSKAVPTKTPTGKRMYGNKMIWWKDMFSTHYEQYKEELFTEELDTSEVLGEAEAEMSKPKNKDKEGAVRYKAMADYIWKNYLKTDTHKEFKDLVFRKYEEYHDTAESTPEAKTETNDADTVAAPESEEPSDDASADDEDEDDDEDAKPAKKDPAKKPAAKKPAAKKPAATKKATPAKKPAAKKPAAKK